MSLVVSIFVFILYYKTCQENGADASLAQTGILVLKAVGSVPLLGACSLPGPTPVPFSLLRLRRTCEEV